MSRPSLWSGFHSKGWNHLSHPVRAYVLDIFGKDRLSSLETLGLKYGLFEHRFFEVFQSDPPNDPSYRTEHAPFLLCEMLSSFATALSESNHHHEAVTVLDAAVCNPHCRWITFGQLALSLHWAGRRHAAEWAATQAKTQYEKEQREGASLQTKSAEERRLLVQIERLCEWKDPYASDSHRAFRQAAATELLVPGTATRPPSSFR